MSVDEQETDSVPSRGRREAPEQQGAIAADDEREVPVIDDRRALRSLLESARTDQIADAGTPTDILKDDSFSSVASVGCLSFQSVACS